MARILYTGLVSELKGSIGGFSFQKNGAGNIVRLKPVRSTVNSLNQSVRIIAFSKAVQAWNNLSISDQSLWSAFAIANPKLNYWSESKKASGMNWFIALYNNAVLLGKTPFTVPPTYAVIAQFPVFSITYNASTLNISFSASDPGSAGYNFIYCSNAVGDLRHLNRRIYRLISISGLDPATPFILASAYKSYFNLSSLPVSASGSSHLLVAIASIHPTSLIASAFTFKSIDI